MMCDWIDVHLMYKQSISKTDSTSYCLSVFLLQVNTLYYILHLFKKKKFIQVLGSNVHIQVVI